VDGRGAETEEGDQEGIVEDLLEGVVVVHIREMLRVSFSITAFELLYATGVPS
jgi:hypothetical protein